MKKPGPSDRDATPTAGAPRAPRREFLKATAAAAGATLVPAIAHGDPAIVPPAGTPSGPLDTFDHLVVLMLENHSFDNMLGYLYPAGFKPYPPGSTYHGLADFAWWNPGPNNGLYVETVYALPNPPTAFSNPSPNPGEGYRHTNVQLFGPLHTEHNEPAPGQPPNMGGFVVDYYENLIYRYYHPATKKNKPAPIKPAGWTPSYEQYRVIMNTHTPAQLPVLSTLAQSFAVFDAWFCAVPSQTYCNRSFFHASTSIGQVDNSPTAKWNDNGAKTIFDRLYEKGRSWKIYYDEANALPLTLLIHSLDLMPYWMRLDGPSFFATMDEFHADVASGSLPDYAFIEPNFFSPDASTHNSQHPPQDVRKGEQLVYDIYTAVRKSATVNGSNASNTLLLITYDEHGGCYDHVPPGPAVPPGDNPPIPPDIPFGFDRLGVRVPTIAISAYAHPNTVVNSIAHHAAVIRTLRNKFGLARLTDRDDAAGTADISEAINLTAPRDPGTWPDPTPLVTREAPAAADPRAPLNERQQEFVELAMAAFTGEEPRPQDVPTTIGAASALLKEFAALRHNAPR